MGLVGGRVRRASARRRTRRPRAGAGPRPRRSRAPERGGVVGGSGRPGAGAAAARRSRPAATSTWYQSDALVPSPSGLTVARRRHDVVVDAVLRVRRRRWSAPKRRAGRWSRSRRTAASGAVPSGAGAGQQLELAEERVVDRRCAPSAPRLQRRASAASTSHDQVLRNHTVGSTCSVVGVGPGVGDPDRHQQVGRDRPWRSRPRRSSSGRRRTRRCRAARTRGRACPAGRSRRSGRRRGTRACG